MRPQDYTFHKTSRYLRGIRREGADDGGNRENMEEGDWSMMRSHAPSSADRSVSKRSKRDEEIQTWHTSDAQSSLPRNTNLGKRQYEEINEYSAHAQQNRGTLTKEEWLCGEEKDVQETCFYSGELLNDSNRKEVGDSAAINFDFPQNETEANYALQGDINDTYLGRINCEQLIPQQPQPTDLQLNTQPSLLGPIPHIPNYTPSQLKESFSLQHLTMDISDEQIIAQFAALSADDETNPNMVHIPQQAVKTRKWELCLLMRVTAQKIVFENTFSTALRQKWGVHPDTLVEGLGSNLFVVEFKDQMDMMRILARGPWKLNKGDMVVCKQLLRQEDLVNPEVNEIDVWVELHGIPPGSLDQEGLQLMMSNVGAPLTELMSLFYGDRRVYRQKLRVNIKKALKPKLPMNHPTRGVCWVCVVYENMGNICMFCATVGHEHVICPLKFRLKQMKEQGQYLEQLGSKEIPETQVGKWIADRTLVPREGLPVTRKETSAGSSEAAEQRRDKKQKRLMDLNENDVALLCLEGGHENHGVEQGHNKPLNCKRAREANPNSLPSHQ